VPIITRTQIDAYAHCAQQVGPDGSLAFNAEGVPEGDERCPGYAQQKVRAIRELIEFSYLDGGADPSDPVRMIERGVEHLHRFDSDDAPCPHCGYPRELTDQVRPRYSNLGGGGPDAIFAQRWREREKAEAARSQASAADRQAAALERANELEERRVAAAERANELEAIKLGLNGDDEPGQRPSDVAPRRKRSATS
jgi:hypothetical protein